MALIKEEEGSIIPDDILNGLVMNRLNQIDCYLQGSVIEGFPVTDTQISCLEQLKINPSLVVLIDAKADFIT